MQVVTERCKKCGEPLPGPSAVAASRPTPMAPVRVPPTVAAIATAVAPAVAASTSPDAAFDHDRFLLRQKVLTIHEKYDICDEQGQKILFIERPGHHLKNLLALVAGLAAAALVAAPIIALAAHWDSPMLGVAGALAGFAALLVVAVRLSPFRHIDFYRDESRQEKILQVLQDQKATIFTQTFTVVDAGGRPIARLSKNPLTNSWRKTWKCAAPDGRPICIATEDSLLKALFRKFVAKLFPMNFIIVRDDELLGTFNRNFTLFDRYVLDLTHDRTRSLDRRIAVAIGVLLDTGERR
jgi:uncharacterized protein YxjI